MCGSRGCARVTSEVDIPKDELEYEASGPTRVQLGDGREYSFTAAQINAASVVGFFEHLGALERQLGLPMSLQPEGIRQKLDVEMDKMVQTFTLPVRGPNGNLSLEVVYLIDPLNPHHKTISSIKSADGKVYFENKHAALQRLYDM
jgi:hypothetical protein